MMHILTQHIQQHKNLYVLIIATILVLVVSFNIGYIVGNTLSKSSMPTQIEESAADILDRIE